MKWCVLSLMLVLGFTIGCDKPVDEPFPSPASSSGGSGGTTDAAAEAPAEKPAAEAGEKSDAKPEEGKADAKPADAPASDKAATEKTEAAKPADSKPAEEPVKADAKKEGSASLSSGAKFVSLTTLKVPTMSCPHGCWPTVQETLAKQPGVASVELAKQANDTEINNPQVFIKLNGKFDATAAISALAKAGFDKAEVVN